MTIRRFAKSALFTSLAVGALALLPSSQLLAQDTSQPEVENSRYQISGIINANAVFVRSGPSENDYATLKLDRGAEVVVVGERFNWLKIIPPDGSFCYVAKAYVNRAGNGTVGQVTNTLNVRIGSALNLLKTKVATKLEPNERVEILGEQDEYFKIKPPKNVYLYINKQFVDPVKPVVVDNATGALKPAAPDEAAPPAPRDPTAGAQQFDATATDDTATAGGATTRESTASAGAATQPSASAEAEFERLEATYAEVSQRPLDEQPVEELLAGYQKLASSDGLPESMRRICDFKASVLKTRAELKAEFVSTKKIQEDMKAKQMALRAEQGEIEQRVKATEVQFYTAVGTLRTSSLQQGRQTLYRLTDPSNGRTVVYLGSNDPKLGQHLGEFIGVRGEVSTDPQLGLRMITPTVFETVNPAKVGQSIAAQIVPPSLLPAAASTSD